MWEKMHQTIPSQYIDKRKLVEFLSTRNEPSSFTVTRKLDKYHIEYSHGAVQQLSWVQSIPFGGQAPFKFTSVTNYVYQQEDIARLRR